MAKTLTQKDKVRKLRDEIEDLGYMVLLWSPADIQSIRPTLSSAEAKLVLQQAKREYNSATGISWETLEALVERMFPPKVEKRGRRKEAPAE